MIIKNEISVKLIGIVFQVNNQYLALGYHELIKRKHSSDNIVVIDSQILSEHSELFDRIFIISDYIHYSSQCVCAGVNSNKEYIIDESGNAITRLCKGRVNKNAHDWVQGKTSLRQPECLYCRTLKNLSLPELNFISTLMFNVSEVSDIKKKIMSYLDIDRKAYSRILRKLLIRLELKNEHALFQWADIQTHQDLKEI